MRLTVHRIARCFAALALLAFALAFGAPWASAQEEMRFGADLVSDYVFRGDDYYVRAFTKDAKQHTETNNTPALRPTATFFGPEISFNITGTFALTNRDDDLNNSHGPFYGFARDDELDYTLNYHWRNRVGGFTGGIIYYTFLDANRVGPTSITPIGNAPTPTEVMIRWELPFWGSIHPTLAQYGSNTPGNWYSHVGINGNRGRFSWDLNAGFVRTGTKDVTGAIEWNFGLIQALLNASYRPDPTTLSFQNTTAGVQGYDTKGNYQPDPASAKTAAYPSTIYWLTLRYRHNVK